MTKDNGVKQLILLAILVKNYQMTLWKNWKN